MKHPCAAILDAEGLRLTSQERRFFRDADPWGFILFSRNIESPDQVRALTSDMRDIVGRDAPILIDQEGGRVQRLGPPHWRQWSAPLDTVRRAGAQAARAMYLRYRIIASELRALGIDVNCAPTLDLARSETHPFLRNRCYGSDPKTVALIGAAVADGLMDGGVLPVMKHMPGHGRAVADSHLELPCISAPLEDLQNTDFAVFRTLNHVSLGMTAHIVLEVLNDVPVTMSQQAIGLIRDEIGFGGLLMSDDLSMGAMPGTPAERTRAAIDAGCDVALYCNASLETRRAVADAAGRMNSVAMARAEAALSRRDEPEDVDILALEAEFDTLLTKQGR